MKKQNKIEWKPAQVLVSKIKPTPNNYKIKTDLGKQRLQKSLTLFGLAGTVILNKDFTLIDGNSRYEEALEKKEKYLWASMPNRLLTPTEFKEMAAMYDFAKAGEVDLKRIQQDLGTTADWYKKWNMETPMAVLAKLGKAGAVEEEYVDEAPEVKNGKKEKVKADTGVRMVQLFFSPEQEEEFRKIVSKLEVKFKVDNITEAVFKALKSIKLK